MSSYRKNIMVGALMLGALFLIGWMFLEFSGRFIKAFAPPQITLHFDTTRADGLSEGSAVLYLGVNVGRITEVKRMDDGNGVSIQALVVRNPPLPANLSADISSNNALGGTATLNLTTRNEKPKGQVADGALIHANYVGLQLNFLSPEFTTAAGDVGKLSAELTKTVAQLNKDGAIQHLDATIQQIRDTATKTGDLMQAMNETIGDAKTRQDLSAAIANIRTTTDNAAKISAKMDILVDKLQKNSDEVSGAIQSTRGHVDDLSKALGDRLVQVSAVLDNVKDITDKLDKGKGTAGELINDPKLYQSLVDSSRELSATVADLHRLIEQWEQEGVTLKVK